MGNVELTATGRGAQGVLRNRAAEQCVNLDSLGSPSARAGQTPQPHGSVRSAGAEPPGITS